MMILRPFVLLVLFCLACGLPAQQVSGGEDRPLSGSLGLSYLGTGGNTHVRTLGVDLGLGVTLPVWAFEGAFSWMNSRQEGVLQAERLMARLKGSRSLGEACSLFVAPSWERDRFSGFDARWALALGLGVTRPLGMKDTLIAELGFSWNRDEPRDLPGRSFMGGLVQVRYQHAFNEANRLEQRLLWVPNFRSFSAWTGEAETALVAGLSARLALKATFLLRFRHEPLEGYSQADTSTALSLVCTL